MANSLKTKPHNTNQLAAHGIDPLLRRPAVQQLTGMSRATIYRRIKQGLFVPPVPNGGAISTWPASEIAAINAARIAGKSDAAIKALVADLGRSRAQGGAV
jgi:prophage regulatory protein